MLSPTIYFRGPGTPCWKRSPYNIVLKLDSLLPSGMFAYICISIPQLFLACTKLGETIDLTFSSVFAETGINYLQWLLIYLSPSYGVFPHSQKFVENMDHTFSSVFAGDLQLPSGVAAYIPIIVIRLVLTLAKLVATMDLTFSSVLVGRFATPL